MPGVAWSSVSAVREEMLRTENHKGHFLMHPIPGVLVAKAPSCEMGEFLASRISKLFLGSSCDTIVVSVT